MAKKKSIGKKPAAKKPAPKKPVWKWVAAGVVALGVAAMVIGQMRPGPAPAPAAESQGPQAVPGAAAGAPVGHTHEEESPAAEPLFKDAESALAPGAELVTERYNKEEDFLAKVSKPPPLARVEGTPGSTWSEAALLLRKGRFNVALPLLLKIRPGDEHYPEALLNLGYIQYIRKDYPAADDWFEKALAQKDLIGREDALYYQVLTHIGLHDLTHAIELARAAAKKVSGERKEALMRLQREMEALK
jgi:tetratricopeptide (TPR) repeat protein